LRKALEIGDQLEVPEPPPLFLSQPMNWKGELILPEGVKRGRVREASIVYEPTLRVLEFFALCELDGEVRWYRMGRFDPLLLETYQAVRDLLREAIRLFQGYIQELNGLRNRILSTYSREILTSDL
jgi:hypothetical protein